VAAISYSTCACCSLLFGWQDKGQESPARCSMCEERAGLCVHNLGERSAKGPAPFHFSTQGPHNGGDPGVCPPCVESRERLHWYHSLGSPAAAFEAERLAIGRTEDSPEASA
jgi:hypothetical protein